jgi:hypothetical protein
MRGDATIPQLAPIIGSRVQISIGYSPAGGVDNIEGSHVTLQSQVKKVPLNAKQSSWQGKSPVIPEKSRATNYAVGGKMSIIALIFLM